MGEAQQVDLAPLRQPGRVRIIGQRDGAGGHRKRIVGSGEHDVAAADVQPGDSHAATLLRWDLGAVGREAQHDRDRFGVVDAARVVHGRDDGRGEREHGCSHRGKRDGKTPSRAIPATACPDSGHDPRAQHCRRGLPQ